MAEIVDEATPAQLALRRGMFLTKLIQEAFVDDDDFKAQFVALLCRIGGEDIIGASYPQSSSPDAKCPRCRGIFGSSGIVAVRNTVLGSNWVHPTCVIKR